MKKLNTQHTGSGIRRKDIIRAALACFTGIGYDETTISDICARANASTGSLYHHFKSKENLAAEVYFEGIKEYQSGLLEILTKEKKAARGIAAVVRYHLTWVADNPDWAGFLFQKRHESFMRETESLFNEMNKNFATGISGWFKDHIHAGTIRRLNWTYSYPLCWAHARNMCASMYRENPRRKLKMPSTSFPGPFGARYPSDIIKGVHHGRYNCVIL
jgi:AcrR family transcriptional regulator